MPRIAHHPLRCTSLSSGLAQTPPYAASAVHCAESGDNEPKGEQGTMTQALDLLKIAQEEQSGDLFKYLDRIYKRSKVQPTGYTDAIIWEGGNNAGGVNPVAHAFTDMFALNGTI